MKKILINGFSAKSGGGKVIFDNFISNIPLKEDVDFYIIYPPNYDGKYKENVVNISSWMSKLPGLFFFYLVYLPYYVRKIEIDYVLNFADIILPFIRNQTYFFDWAYLVIDNKEFWNSMNLKMKLTRKLKKFLIYSLRDNNSNVIVQSNELARQYRKVMKFNGNLVISPTPILILNNGFNHGVTSKDFVYVSNYAPHKNFQVIPDIALGLKKRGFNGRIILTLNENSSHWQELKKNISMLGISDTLITIGQISNNDVFEVLRSCKALFFPSLLESYGMPLLEALICGTPVITSDTKFSRSVCGNSVIYFDPNNTNEIITKLFNFDNENCDLEVSPIEVKEVLEKIPTWEEFSKAIITESIR